MLAALSTLDSFQERPPPRSTLELGDSGDDFTMASIIEVIDLDGNVIGGGCATAAGTRFAWNGSSGD